ncbi:MAG: NAD(P)-dependent oxidoreductase [Candidatus Rokuibacteriota bacterium]|nr:MAG: NAD(P)-dependent oxidoreductase [Candidatus Rokubacteria bacterium]
MATLGFVGLGTMGSRMAQRLLDAGHSVVGYNRTREKAKPLVDRGMRLADSPRAVSTAAEVVFSMVTDPEALRAVADGADGLVAGLRPGAVYVDMSTVSPSATREVGAAVEARGAAMLDAPVSGSIATLEQGKLAIMVGGDPGVLERVRPYLAAIGPTITYVGPLGLAVTMKIAINLSLGVQMLAFSEAVLLAEKGGVPRERAVEALLKSVAGLTVLREGPPSVRGRLLRRGERGRDRAVAFQRGRGAAAPGPSRRDRSAWGRSSGRRESRSRAVGR